MAVFLHDAKQKIEASECERLLDETDSSDTDCFLEEISSSNDNSDASYNDHPGAGSCFNWKTARGFVPNRYKFDARHCGVNSQCEININSCEYDYYRYFINDELIDLIVNKLKKVTI